jgi:hypothetical protein
MRERVIHWYHLTQQEGDRYSKPTKDDHNHNGKILANGDRRFL